MKKEQAVLVLAAVFLLIFFSFVGGYHVRGMVSEVTFMDLLPSDGRKIRIERVDVGSNLIDIKGMTKMKDGLMARRARIAFVTWRDGWKKCGTVIEEKNDHPWIEIFSNPGKAFKIVDGQSGLSKITFI